MLLVYCVQPTGHTRNADMIHVFDPRILDMAQEMMDMATNRDDHLQSQRNQPYLCTSCAVLLSLTHMCQVHTGVYM